MSELRTTSAQRIAAFTSSLAFEQIPDEVIEATKLHVLDVLGCGLAAHGLGVAGEGRATMAELGTGDATAIGLDTPLPAPHAAFANAMLCHGLDYDDTHSDSVCHITVVVVPAALAVAESLGRSGEDVLTAVTAGTEVVSRIGMAASGAFHARGFHPTSVCGVFGATAAAARLAGLDAETTTSALGLAGSMSSGLMAYLNDGTPTKPVHAGWAAQAGVLAARLAAHGAEGPAGVLDGRFGVFHAFVDDDESLPRRAARRPRQPLGDAPRLVQAVPGVSLHARLPRCDRVPARRRGGRADRRGDRDRPRDARPGDPRARGREAPSPDDLRGQVQPPVLDRRDARPRPRRPHDVHGRRAAATRTSSSSHGRSGTRGAASRRIRVPFPARPGFGRRTVARSRPSWPTSRERRRTR